MPNDGKFKFSFSAGVSLVAVLMTIIAAAFALSGQLTKQEIRMDNVEEMMGGVKGRVCNLENEMKEGIKQLPDWFEGIFNDFRKEMKESVKQLNKELVDLNLKVASLSGRNYDRRYPVTSDLRGERE